MNSKQQYIIAAFSNSIRYVSADNGSSELYPRYSVDRAGAMVFESHKAAVAFINGIDDSTSYTFDVKRK